MSDEVLETYIKSYIETAPQQQVTFLWQGGEPTMASLDELVATTPAWISNSRSAEQAIAPANPAQLHRVKTS